MARKPTDTAHLNLRYPEALRRRLERAGKSNGRSLNSEIVDRLEQSFWLQVTLPESLRGRLEQAAKDHGCSLNTEIFDRLDVSFQRENQEKMIEKAARDAVQAHEELTRKLLAAELSKSKSPPKGGDST